MATTINGTIGNDTINSAGSPVGLRTNPFSVAESIVAFGNSGFDRIYGSTNADEIYGNTGDDTILGNGGSDKLYGGQGNDDIYVTGVAASTTEPALGVKALAVGGQGQDEIYVGGYTESRESGSGFGGVFTGSVTVFGGAESNDVSDQGDLIVANLDVNSSATIYGNGGNDTIYADATNRSIAGDLTSKFYIHGGQGNDDIYGDVGTGSTVIGGLQTDYISIDATNSVTIYGGNGTDSAQDGNDTIYADVYKDGFLTTDPTASIYGNGGADYISLYGENSDVKAGIFGGQGNDTIYAYGDYTDSSSGGDDVLVSDYWNYPTYGLASNSTVAGGLGTDYIDVRVNGQDVSIYGGNGTADPTDGADYVEVNLGDTASVQVFGNGGDDILYVYGSGSASVFGGAGNDTFYLYNQNDVQGEFPQFVELTGGRDSDLFDIYAREDDTREIGAFVRITDFDFDEDRIAGDTVDTLRSASGTANNFDGIVNLAGGVGDGTAALVTVTSGNLAGSYLVYDNHGATQVVEITGYTGSADADVFVGSNYYS
ncbi:calcium-binding protein [Aureimonas sp. SK2]|uniref:beta strand repeat-containing protein n=1 Tax=Aureimonas sp. SK2 TaxID=3015992 RepID=UPI002444F63C|nr:calcium-binding protein [Aureimonas sp. SK2]